jgi:hypothetical protein
VRLKPNSPPTPVSVKPKPSWIAGRSMNRAKNIDQDSPPPAAVSIRTTAQMPTPSRRSSITPA